MFFENMTSLYAKLQPLVRGYNHNSLNGTLVEPLMLLTLLDRAKVYIWYPKKLVDINSRIPDPDSVIAICVENQDEYIIVDGCH